MANLGSFTISTIVQPLQKIGYYTSPLAQVSTAPIISGVGPGVAYYLVPSYSFTRYDVINRKSEQWG